MPDKTPTYENDPVSVDQDDLIWHFTKPESLKPILQNGLFGTNATDLKDGTECLIRREWMSALVPCLRLAFPNEFPIKDEIILKTGIENGKFRPAFITSLCESPIFDYMWSTYTRDGGYAIGFDKVAVQRYASGNSIRLRECSYDKYELLHQQALQLTNSISTLSRNVQRVCREKGKNGAWIAEKLLLTIERHASEAAFVKQRQFILEQEMRLLHLLTNKAASESVRQTDDRRHILVSFDEHPAQSVKHILVSPFGDESNNLEAAKKMAAEFHIPDDHIETFRQSNYRTSSAILSRPDVKAAYHAWTIKARS